MILDHHSRKDQRKRMLIVLIVLFLFMIVEIVVAFLSKSLALLADAGHILTDAGALSLSLIAIWFTEKPPTAGKTYGYYRSEILAGFINASVLIAVSIFILISAWQRLNAPPVIEPVPVFFMAILGLAINLFCMRLVSDGHKHHDKSINAKAVYLELLGDTLASVGVIISSIVIIFFHWYQVDVFVGFLIGVFILVRTWGLLSECIHILMEGTPPHVDVEALKNTVLSLPEIIGIHDVHVWTITSGLDAMSAHILINIDANSDEVLNTVTDILRDKFNLNHTTIQIEQASCNKDACS